MFVSPSEYLVDSADIGGLSAALDLHRAELGPAHPQTLAIANLLATALWATGEAGEAADLLLEMLARCSEQQGPHHPATVVAKSDLAAILGELGNAQEAARLEAEAFESAQMHLGRKHPVSTVLLWNRALRFEDQGNTEGARQLVTDELAWLLTEDHRSLPPEQAAIRMMLAQRLNWDVDDASQLLN